MIIRRQPLQLLLKKQVLLLLKNTQRALLKMLQFLQRHLNLRVGELYQEVPIHTLYLLIHGWVVQGFRVRLQAICSRQRESLLIKMLFHLISAHQLIHQEFALDLLPKLRQNQ